MLSPPLLPQSPSFFLLITSHLDSSKLLQNQPLGPRVAPPKPQPPAQTSPPLSLHNSSSKCKFGCVFFCLKPFCSSVWPAGPSPTPKTHLTCLDTATPEYYSQRSDALCCFMLLSLANVAALLPTSLAFTWWDSTYLASPCQVFLSPEGLL